MYSISNSRCNSNIQNNLLGHPGSAIGFEEGHAPPKKCYSFLTVIICTFKQVCLVWELVCLEMTSSANLLRFKLLIAYQHTHTNQEIESSYQSVSDPPVGKYK